MSKVILPYIEPMYTTYHFLASPGIAAKQNNTSDNWYYNNTIEWRCRMWFLGSYTGLEIRINDGSVHNIPIIDRTRINIRFAGRCVIDIIKNIINEGFYVTFNDIDDYYIKGKCWYKEKHFNHEGMIIGYDDEKNTFIMAGYDQRWIYTVFETPQECFVEGMTSSCEQGVYGWLYAIRVKNEIYELNTRNIYNNLKKYLSSDINIYPLNTKGIARGIVVYDFICMYLDKLIDGSIPHHRRDRRVFRMVWEHKKCMLGRIKAVENLYGWDNELSSAYEEIVKMADKMRFIYSKFVLKYSSNNLEKIQVMLMRMKKLEVDLLGKFLNELEGKLNADQ